MSKIYFVKIVLKRNNAGKQKGAVFFINTNRETESDEIQGEIKKILDLQKVREKTFWKKQEKTHKKVVTKV